MKQRFFFWLKNYLGFTNKESQGFLVLIPVLFLLSLIPNLIQTIKDREGQRRFDRYSFLIDSLDQAGFTVVSAPRPGFDPSDTVPFPKKEVIKNTVKIDFSEADSVTLQIVPGIGPAMAARLVKFRESIGGLHSAEQLLEVFGLKPETYDMIWEYFEFSPLIFRKIQINSAEIEEISSHPYFSYGEAKVIVAFRKQHGKYSGKEDLLKIKIFKPEWVEKVAPYLDFN